MPCKPPVESSPRMQGALPVLKTIASTTGSSPQMRGALRRRMGARHRPGIIPADAGSTRRAPVCMSSYSDHPRGCGEHRAPPYSVAPWPGSSPRMRGAHTEVNHDIFEVRIIPADAGSTPRLLSQSRRWSDHPRGCGEHSALIVGLPLMTGSSPRMRGALRQTEGLVRPGRIIPADAGSTLR